MLTRLMQVWFSLIGQEFFDGSHSARLVGVRHVPVIDHLLALSWLADRRRATSTFHPLLGVWSLRLYGDDRSLDLHAVPQGDGTMVQLDAPQVIWV